jgi:D-alanine-D-alanine ligase
MKIGLTYDLRQDYLAQGYSAEETAEFDSIETIEAIESTLQNSGFIVERIGNIKQLVVALANNKRWDLVFNIAEGMYGLGREAQIPALLDAYQIPYTFSDPLTLALTLDKAMTKQIVQAHQIPTASFAVVAQISEIDSINLSFPLFAKPLAEGTSKGIHLKSIVNSQEELQSTCHDLLQQFHQPVLVESFLPGREFTVGILGTGENAKILGVLEIFLRDDKSGVYTFNNKEFCESRVSYEIADDLEAQLAAESALKAWKILRCKDAGRVDLRSDAKGIPQFLEINPLSGLHPTHSDLPIMASLLNMSYSTFLNKIVNSSLVPRSILILHSDVATSASADELDTLYQVEQIQEGLMSLGYYIEKLPWNKNFSQNSKTIVQKNKTVFNLVESIDGRNDDVHLIPLWLKESQLTYTGCQSEAIFNTTHKILAKERLIKNNIPTPKWFSADKKNLKKINEKYIIKSLMEDGSIGIDHTSVSDKTETLIEIITDRKERFGGEWFAEQYVPGREFNVSLMEDKGRLRVLPIAEIKFVDYQQDELTIVDYAAKWDSQSKAYHHTPICFDFSDADQPLLKKLSDLAIQCWHCFELSGYARVDFRVDEAGNPWVLEVNANPCLNKDAGFVAACAYANISYEEMLENIIACAVSG